MSSATGDARPALDDVDRRQTDLPPVHQLAMVTLALVIAGGIYMAAHIDHSGTLIPPTVLAAAAALVLVVNVGLLARIRQFAWDKFFQVFGWSLIAYLVIAGILEFVFVYDHTPGRQLVLFSVMLAMFAVNVPLLLGFSVARYQPVPD